MKITKSTDKSEKKSKCNCTVYADESAQPYDAYSDAIACIYDAIESLSELARNDRDEKAREAVANLGVVLLDLRS